MKDFLQEHTFYNMMKQNACFKGDGGLSIDLLIINSKFSFMKTPLKLAGIIIIIWYIHFWKKKLKSLNQRN